MSEAFMTAALAAKALTKDYRSSLGSEMVRALDHLDLEIRPGEIFGLLGPNGSGKSTAIKLLLGLIAPTSGSCSIAGFASTSLEARRHVGYLPEMPDFYRFLSGRELVAFYARVSGVQKSEIAARVEETIDWVGLREAAGRAVGTYSKGMLQRIGLAQAIVHDPEVVLLDEPTAGVDPIGAAAMGDLILKLSERGKTVLISSHLLAHVEELCHRVAILHRGIKIAEGTVDALTRVDADSQVWRLENLPESSLKELRDWLATRGARIVREGGRQIALEQVFCRIVGENEERRRRS